VKNNRIYVDANVLIDYGQGLQYAIRCIDELRAKYGQRFAVSTYALLETLAVITRVTQFSKLPKAIYQIVKDPREQAVLWLRTFIERLQAEILDEVECSDVDPRLHVKILRLYAETINTMLNLVEMHKVGIGDLIHLTYMRLHGIDKLVTTDERFAEAAQRMDVEVHLCRRNPQVRKFTGFTGLSRYEED